MVKRREVSTGPGHVRYGFIMIEEVSGEKVLCALIGVTHYEQAPKFITVCEGITD